MMDGKTATSRSLATRLFAILFASVFLSFLVATSIAAYVSWTVYEGDAEERLFSQLELEVSLLEGEDLESMVDALHGVSLSDTRITLVAEDGTVLYDSLVDERELGNHGNREEVRAAKEQGESVVLRKSETTGTDTLYAAAVVGSEGAVLRLAESRTSLAFYLGGLVAPLLLAILVAVLLSALIARVVTRRMTAPLLNVDLDSPSKDETYREIEPLLDRISAQRAELLRQNEQLESAMEMRREFTANVSHEMKSPLQVIGGYAELIESGIASEEDTKRFVGLIRSESISMRQLIDDVLMLSKLDEGRCGQIAPVDVSSVIARVVERLARSAEEGGVHVIVDGDEGVLVEGVDSLVEQAIYNLVDNAICHGGSSVVVSAVSDGDRVRVVVADDGPGVPADQRDRVFERFYRLDSSRSRSTGGTGLGLAIVKHAAESMGGAAWVEDSELGGAAFLLQLNRAGNDAGVVIRE